VNEDNRLIDQNSISCGYVSVSFTFLEVFKQSMGKISELPWFLHNSFHKIDALLGEE